MGVLDSKTNTSLDDDGLGGNGLVVATHGGSQPDIYLAAGEGETCQATGGSESNVPQVDGSTASEAVLGCDCMDTSTTLIGLACADSGVLILGDSQRKVQLASMESLPSDIVQEILSRVPAEYVLECKLVCKKWVALIRGNNFANMHLSHQLNHLYDGDDGDDGLAAKTEPYLFFAGRIEAHDEFRVFLFHGGQLSDRISTGEKYIYNQNLKRIYHPHMHTEYSSGNFVGSCNGLVCAFELHNTILDPIYICNPLTREYVYLPRLVVKKEDLNPYEPHRIREGEVNMFYHTACGFGYVRSTNEYKVVRIHYLKYEEGNVEVYTLGSGLGWRCMGKLPYRLSVSDGGRGTYANDVIYWRSRKKVVAFDLANEEFRLVSAPPCMDKLRSEHDCRLVALGSQLCLYLGDELRLKIWSLMKGSGSKDTWCFEFDIDYQAVGGSRKRKFRPILLRKTGEMVFLFAESVLYCYDPETTYLKMISNEASTEDFKAVEVMAHLNTFASLEAMGEKSKRYTVCTPLDDVIDELDRVALDEEIDRTCFRFQTQRDRHNDNFYDNSSHDNFSHLC